MDGQWLVRSFRGAFDMEAWLNKATQELLESRHQLVLCAVERWGDGEWLLVCRAVRS